MSGDNVKFTKKITQSGGLTITLLILWLVLSGYTTPLLLFLGAVSVALVVVISQRMQLIEYHKPNVLLQTLRSVPYGFWLLARILESNIDVCKRILNPKLPVSPVLIRLASSQEGDLARTAYANSITLTPGTVSIDVDGKDIEVHALTQAGARELAVGDMDRRITEVEKKSYV